ARAYPARTVGRRRPPTDEAGPHGRRPRAPGDVGRRLGRRVRGRRRRADAGNDRRGSRRRPGRIGTPTPPRGDPGVLVPLLGRRTAPRASVTRRGPSAAECGPRPGAACLRGRRRDGRRLVPL
ncbi:MAG: hypothetical protein AVDCRST_MAG49-1862, partial [uncultured Thermomicrobiales bacterium]